VRRPSSPSRAPPVREGRRVSRPGAGDVAFGAVHSLARRYIKTGVVFLAAGLVLGVYMIVRRELGGAWPSPYLVTAHTHAILVGFLMFMILGVALWLFPRTKPDDPRYRPGRVAAAYWILLVGSVARFAGELARPWTAAAWLRWTVVLAGTAQAVGLLVFFWAMWPRIRPVGSHVREARGERF
jgi:heme/copper-type cytochrome/quinol oxidase subunit 1